MYQHTIIAVLHKEGCAGEYHHLASSFPAVNMTASKIAVAKECKRIYREYSKTLLHAVIMINGSWAMYPADAVKKLGDS